MNLPVLNALGIVDCAIFKRVDVDTFILEDSGGVWLRQLFPDIVNLDHVIINSQLIFLHDFLIDAEDYWHSQSTSQLKSGIWTEVISDSTLYLEACASKVGEQAYLIIRNVEQIYHEQKQTLQIAREILISNSEVVERHNYLCERLRALLLDNSDSQNRLPLHEAIRYASVGIVITDANLEVLEANDAGFSIFDEPIGTAYPLLIAKIKDLLIRQYPEKSIFTGKNSWQGEVYWHLPPQVSKWVNISVNPVFSEIGNVSHWIISFSDQTRIKHLMQNNEELALHDPLTGLPNRSFFWQQLQHFIANKHEFYLLNIDIINFTYINEVFGYLEGDELLKQISIRLSSELSEGDFITRMSADEFMIIHRKDEAKLNSQKISFEQETREFAEQLYSISTQAYYTKDLKRCDMPIKIGITHSNVDLGSAETLLTNTALALSYAKNNADNHIQFYNDKLKQASARRLRLEQALKSSIENAQLEVYLQPIFEIGTKKLIKAEALLRWHYNDEVIMPDEFIPIAESSNMINCIGRWVIKQVCMILSLLREQNIEIPISINFSPNQISDPKLIPFIENTLNEYLVNPKLIEFEVTEGVLIINYQKVSTFLEELKQLGFAISVDDFGTGYCSLSYLKNLPIDTLKIDRTFVNDIAKNENGQAIVSAIIALGQKLKLGIIAEGIENKAQESFLLANNCHQAQGFLYSKPISLETFVSKYAENSNSLLS